jgi:hypothetical protein
MKRVIVGAMALVAALWALGCQQAPGSPPGTTTGAYPNNPTATGPNLTPPTPSYGVDSGSFSTGMSYGSTFGSGDGGTGVNPLATPPPAYGGSGDAGL